ncbi:sugar O-acetyltransferase [Nocardia abscessus]|uniref:sugar O-acetyltransferase n=2 Tax=Nocardia abscessus TaxID=120957 RepID=UPI002453D3F0|nr:sugar O-acetyltransferase [Nocardia abscessus]
MLGQVNRPDADDRSMRDRMLAGELYRADDPELREQSLRAMDLMEEFNATPMRDAQRRHDLLTELLGGIGDHTEIRPPLRVDYGRHIRIGARTFVNFGLVALDAAPITIGDDVQIGTSVQLLTPTHPLDPDRRRAKWESAAPITIADNVWLGSGVIVLPGVTIGENTVVGAGAVVSSDLPADVVAVGTPARVIRALGPDENR